MGDAVQGWTTHSTVKGMSSPCTALSAAAAQAHAVADEAVQAVPESSPSVKVAQLRPLIYIDSICRRHMDRLYL